MIFAYIIIINSFFFVIVWLMCLYWVCVFVCTRCVCLNVSLYNDIHSLLLWNWFCKSSSRHTTQKTKIAHKNSMDWLLFLSVTNNYSIFFAISYSEWNHFKHDLNICTYKYARYSVYESLNWVCPFAILFSWVCE